MKIYFLIKSLVFIAVFLLCFDVSAQQFIFNGQFRTRTEYRFGQGTLTDPSVNPTFFTSQRMRLNVGYNSDRFKFYTSIQDIRVWGMDGSTISNMDGNKLFLHEGWGEIIFNDTVFLKGLKNLSLKIGRQEIVYDEARLLGNLDWLQQGRRHDAAILKFNKGTWFADAGFAFNQNREKKNAGSLYTGTTYPPQLSSDSVAINAAPGSNFIGTMYKSMQYLYVAKEIGFTKVSFLFFTDNFQKPAKTGNTKFNRSKGVYSRVTTGVTIVSNIKRKHKAEAYGYYQGNQDVSGKTMDAYSAGANILFGIGRKFMIGPGVDFLSGNDLNKPATVNRRFDPLYGTPHKFWGYMDYFYVADAYGLNGNNTLQPGLLNYFLKAKYRLRDNLMANLDIHEFFAGNTVADLSTVATDDELDKRLGTEIDFVLQYSLTKQIGIEFGYSVMMGTNTLDKLKAPVMDKKNIGNWGYIMINIRPDFISAL
ncbi:MAG: alginate export family protein, partial [Cytophagaceae bacterium]|nr:alginate export family protein [Cytophagaceae bacterium]